MSSADEVAVAEIVKRIAYGQLLIAGSDA